MPGNEASGGKLSRFAILAMTSLAVVNAIHPRRLSSASRQRRAAPQSAPPQDLTQPYDHQETVAASPGGVVAIPVKHRPGLVGIVWSIVDRFNRDNAMLTAAGIAFYIFLSIFPGLAAMVSVYGLVGDPTEVSKQIAPFAGLLPPEAMKLLNDGLEGFIKSSANSKVSLALVTSLALALWSARAAMSSIMVGLNIAYEEADQRSFIVSTLVSLALTIGAIGFAVIAIFAIAVVPAVLALVYLGRVLENALFYGRWPLLAVMVILAFAVLYRFAPYRSHARWRWISWGSGVATVFWLTGSFGFSFYVSHFGSYDATYGSLGAVVVLLLWFWVSALIMIIGAEIDSELDTRNTIGGSPMAGTKPSAGPPGGPKPA